MRVGTIVVAVVLTLAGCGHDAPAISTVASKTLQAKVAQIRASASAHDAPAVKTELAALRTQVAQLRRDKRLSATAAQKILDAATAVDQNLFLITTTTTTSPAGDSNNGGNEGGD